MAEGEELSLLHEAFDEIEETGDARKYLIPLNAVKGTAQVREEVGSRAAGVPYRAPVGGRSLGKAIPPGESHPGEPGDPLHESDP
jgi:hypothetical protein